MALLTAEAAWGATRRREGNSRAFSGCISETNHYGAYVQLTAAMSVKWSSASQAHVDWATNDSAVEDCGPSGRPSPGGQLTYHTRLEFIGDQIESCSAGFPGGTSCTIDPHHTQAVYDFSYGPVDNPDGRGSFKVAGAEVNTGKTGHIYSVKFTTSTTLTRGPDATTAQTTVDLHY
jgi:hypothetical protein